MKWDFVDAFLPSRYFFSESILNNQFPLWNPYLLYGVPVFADLVSVFNPEFWIVANLFGYSNISLQFVFLAYIFIAGISFNYFLKQFNVDQKLALALSVAYMLSGLSIGNAQHIAFVYGYALVPFVVASYFIFVRQLSKPNFVRLSIALFLAIFGGYPGFTIILAYLLLSIFVYVLVAKWSDKHYIKNLLVYHLGLTVIVALFSSVLIVAYIQGLPFLNRYSGLPLELAQRHAFTFKSLVSLILPMATSVDSQYFGTDPSMSNAYFGLLGLILFLFAITRKVRKREAYLIIGFGIFSLLASFGSQFPLRKVLYDYFPLMNMFQYPSIFRGFFIFSFLAFAGINLKSFKFGKADTKKLSFFSGVMFLLIFLLIIYSFGKIENFAFFQSGKNFTKELSAATRFDNIFLQGGIQLLVIMAFLLTIWKVKDIGKLSTFVLCLFIIDGIVSTQLNIRQTVISEVNPVAFYKYLKSSPKGFPVPELNPIGENTDKNSENDFVWMNDNVFPKKVTFDGKVSFKLDGYAYLADNHPDLLEAVKKEPLVYFSGDVRKNSEIKDFTSKTVFLSNDDLGKIKMNGLQQDNDSRIKITSFSPVKIEIKSITKYPQLLVYQQNYFTGWKAYVDGEKQDIMTSNFAHMAVSIPEGEHSVVFEFNNSLIKYIFCFSYLIFFGLIVLAIYYLIKKSQGKKKMILAYVILAVSVFVVGSFLNRYFYRKNKSGLTSTIVEKTKKWNADYADITILLSTKDTMLMDLVPADLVLYVDENRNIDAFSNFLGQVESKYFSLAWLGGIINEDIRELLYSFYPQVLDKNIGFNSGIILLEKNESKIIYPISQNFEELGVDAWTKDFDRIETDSVSGNHSYFYSSSDEWGQSTEIIVDKKLKSLKRLTIISDVLFKENVDEALLVFSTERNGETDLYKVTDISEFVDETGKWGRVAFSVDVKRKLQKGDIIKIYFWNIRRIPFLIDNLKVKYIYGE